MRQMGIFVSQDRTGLFVIARKATEEEISNFVSQFPDEPILADEAPVILHLSALRQAIGEIDAMSIDEMLNAEREHAAINSGIEPA